MTCRGEEVAKCVCKGTIASFVMICTHNEDVVSAASMGMTSRRRMECSEMRKRRIQIRIRRLYSDALINEPKREHNNIRR